MLIFFVVLFVIVTDVFGLVILGSPVQSSAILTITVIVNSSFVMPVVRCVCLSAVLVVGRAARKKGRSARDMS